MSQPTAQSSFMIAITFEVAAGRQGEMAALIPQEQAHIRELQQQGVVETLYISADRSRVWLIMRGASQREVEQTLATFPLYPYMRPVFTELTPSQEPPAR